MHVAGGGHHCPGLSAVTVGGGGVPPGAKTKLEATEVQASYPDRLEEEIGTQLLSEPQGQDAREPTPEPGAATSGGDPAALQEAP